MDNRADPHCPACRGAGTTIENEKIDERGEYWCMFVDCYCISDLALAAGKPSEGGDGE